MQDIRLQYKSDDFGNPMYARLAWDDSTQDSRAKPVVLIFHAGGMVLGSAGVIPQPQITHLCASNFLVVMPNYRLCPQVTCAQGFSDCQEALTWATTTLPSLLTKHNYNLTIDKTRIVAMGHSSGGTAALQLASNPKNNLKAALSLYPFIFIADKSTSAHHPAGFSQFPIPDSYKTTPEDWALISPPGKQISEAPFPVLSPDAAPNPRAEWVFNLFKTGKWASTLQPDGDFASIDPMTKLDNSARKSWCPVMIITGSEDNTPGRSIELIERAGKAMKDAGVPEVEIEIVQGAQHVFDHMPSVGVTDLGEGWQAVLRGLHWLESHVGK